VYGGSTTFVAAASGAPPLAYQWQFNGQNLFGATGTTLTLPSLTFADSGAYTYFRREDGLTAQFSLGIDGSEQGF
jgi:hypothetical protein